MRITIAGAGIAGLTAALVLGRRSHKVVVLERSRTIDPLGAGIVLAPNAVRILSALGVKLESCGQPIRQVTIRNAAGAALETTEIDRILPGAGPTLAFHRAELHQALLDTLDPGVELRLGTPLIDTAAGPADLLIGADGIRSTVRGQTCGMLPLRYSGATCWRAITANPGVREGFEAWGGAARVGAIPLTDGRLYVYLVLTAPAGGIRHSSIDGIRGSFSHFAAPVQAILDALAGIELIHHDLEELHAPVWGAGSVVLIGDAAHAMTPNLAQGAAMGIEDAAGLPQAIAAPDPALRMHALRHQRVWRVQRDSRRFGAMAQWDAPAAIWLRNTLIRWMPRSLADRNYRAVVEPGMALDPNASV
jgi:2-polyprenyl-6-methoxyphenol hydroxylase-like FAD-dependent oxidoreductase